MFRIILIPSSVGTWTVLYAFTKLRSVDVRTSTDRLNLVTAYSVVYEPPEDGIKNGPKHVGANFKCFEVF